MVDLDKTMIGTDIKRLKALIACCVFGMSRQQSTRQRRDLHFCHASQPKSL